MERLEISNFIIDYLDKNGKQQDETLHWIACNNFLTREQILYNHASLDKFSEIFDSVLRYLHREFYVNSADGQIWSLGGREKPTDREILTKHEIYTDKVTCFYVMVFDTGCKIGLSTTFEQRLNTYLSPWCKEVIKVYMIETDFPHEIESHLKKCFKKDVVKFSTEYIALPFETIKDEVLAAFPFSQFELYTGWGKKKKARAYKSLPCVNPH